VRAVVEAPSGGDCQLQPGTIGPIGPTGPQGASGPTGAAGPTGPMGTAGATGSAGATGPAGDVGPTGATGPIGSTGPQGDDGVLAVYAVVGGLTTLPARVAHAMARASDHDPAVRGTGPRDHGVGLDDLRARRRKPGRLYTLGFCAELEGETVFLLAISGSTNGDNRSLATFSGTFPWNGFESLSLGPCAVSYDSAPLHVADPVGDGSW
jgi:hypothetical protein